MAKSEFRSKSAQKKADQLAAQASELAFYNNSIGTGNILSASFLSSLSWTKVVDLGNSSVGVGLQVAGHGVPRVVIPRSEKSIKPAVEYQRPPNPAAKLAAKSAGVVINQSNVVANTEDEWIEVRHKKTGARRASEPFE
jgi:hypothetical protein